MRTVLNEFVAQPFLQLRECDSQARLLHEIRAGLSPPDAGVRLKPHLRHRRHQQPAEIRTSRAHAEMKLNGDRLHLVVFRSTPEVELLVYPAGALDVVARVRPDDLVAVVEVKAAPSATQEPTFAEDLMKLARVNDHGAFVCWILRSVRQIAPVGRRDIANRTSVGMARRAG